MPVVAWMMIALGAWLLDSAVKGRAPISTLKDIIGSGSLANRNAHLDRGAVVVPTSATTSSSSASASPQGIPGPTSGGTGAANDNSGPPNTARPPGDVNTWISQAFAILEANGVSPSQLDANAMAQIINGESSGDPYAINRYDINWQNGHASKGVAQTIPETFNAHSLPGYTDIWNPVDNIIASVRYQIATYGSMANTPGVASINSGGGYRPY